MQAALPVTKPTGSKHSVHTRPPVRGTHPLGLTDLRQGVSRYSAF